MISLSKDIGSGKINSESDIERRNLVARHNVLATAKRK